MAEEKNEALGWNDEATATTSEYVPLDPGEYVFRVTDFQRANFDGSDKMAPCPEADITLECANAQTKQTGTVSVRLFLNTKMQWKITQFFKACGLLDPALPDGSRYAMGPLWGKVAGTTGRCVISKRKYRNRDGQERETNDVSRFVVPEAGASRYGSGF